MITSKYILWYINTNLYISI